MVSSEKFCLRWNDFETNISVAFRELREDKDFFDVTLACDDDQIQAHKVILSACSPFFRTILKRNRHEHPLLYLKGVKYIDLMAVLNFMYHGEVNVAQEELNSFLAIAEDLKVKGLTQNKSDETSRKQNVLQTPKLHQRDHTERQDLDPHTQHHKRARTAAAPPDPVNTSKILTNYEPDDDVQVPIKTEPVNLPTEAQHIQIEDHPQHGQVVDPNMDNSVGMYDESYNDYEAYEEDNERGYDGSMGAADNVDGNKGPGPAKSNPSPQERDNMFLIHMATVMDGAVKKWQCCLCGKMAKLKGDILDHVECKHMSTAFMYNCKYCPMEVNTNRKLRLHEVCSCHSLHDH